jgi:hypothetical protein
MTFDKPSPKSGRFHAPVESVEAVQPGELWSLADIMKYLDLNALISAGHDLRYARDRYFDTDNPKGGLKPENLVHVTKALSKMAEVCAAIGAADMNAYVKTYVDKPPVNYEVYDAISRGFWSAVASKWVIFLTPEESGYLSNKQPFGPSVAKHFSEAAFDLESAMRALAFNMPTATVFHLMRAMESAVSLMAKALGVTNTEIEWGKILGPMDEKIRLMAPGPEKKKWSEARADLWHVKECWRNETMHPRRYYTQEQAEEICRAVKTFMVHLASLLAPVVAKKKAPAKPKP